jgi:hypothetical protein
MRPLQPHILIRMSLLLLQMVMVVASIPHFHSSPASEVSAISPYDAADCAAQNSQHACMECVLSGTWVAEPAATADIATALRVRGLAVMLPVPPAAYLATSPAHPRGPPLT